MFLCLAALYESWSIPLSVILVVPLGVLGVVLGVTIGNQANDVYFNVGLITIIGLSAKNAVLIIEFAKDLHAQGKGLVESALEAAHLRFRPIIMTSLAFTLGVMPLVLASGAGSASQRAIGTGVVGGHDQRDRAGRRLRAGILRGGAPHLQGQRTPAADVRPRGQRPGTAAAAPSPPGSSRQPPIEIAPNRREAIDVACRRSRIRPCPRPPTGNRGARRGACSGRLSRSAASAVLLAGCTSMAPKYQRPAAPVEAAFPGADMPAASPGGADRRGHLLACLLREPDTEAADRHRPGRTTAICARPVSRSSRRAPFTRSSARTNFRPSTSASADSAQPSQTGDGTERASTRPVWPSPLSSSISSAGSGASATPRWRSTWRPSKLTGPRRSR